jgi:hypothetical protein
LNVWNDGVKRIRRGKEGRRGDQYNITKFSQKASKNTQITKQSVYLKLLFWT